MPKSKQASGGARQTAARRKERAEKRGPDYRAAEIADFRNLGEPPDPASPDSFRWLAQVAFRAVEGAATDPGLDAEEAREQLARLIPQAAKAADPARLGSRIAALETALTELHERHAADDEGSEDRSARAGATLSG